MELTIEQYAGSLHVPSIGITATDAFEQAISCIDKAIAENDQKEVHGCVATAWVWLDLTTKLLGNSPPNLRESCGLSRLDYAGGCLKNCRHYVSMWEFGYKNPDYLARAWEALGDARESLRGWWEQQS